MAVIPFRRRSNLPIVFGAIAAAVLAFAATTVVLNLDWQPIVGVLHQTNVQVLRPTPKQQPIEVVDGDTVKFASDIAWLGMTRRAWRQSAMRLRTQ
jgi:hypothetical protein